MTTLMCVIDSYAWTDQLWLISRLFPHSPLDPAGFRWPCLHSVHIDEKSLAKRLH